MDTICQEENQGYGYRTEEMNVYAFFYNSDYDRIIFNDGDLEVGKNQEYQTQDLWLTNAQGQPMNIVNGTFDMATLTWFHTNPNESDWSTKMPYYSNSNTYLYGNFSTNNRWKKTHFAYGGEYSELGDTEAMNGTTSGNMIAKVYIKAAGDNMFIVYYNGTAYKAAKNDVNLNVGNSITLGKVNYYVDGHMNEENYQYVSDAYAKNLSAKTVYRFYLSNITTNTITISLAEGEKHSTD